MAINFLDDTQGVVSITPDTAQQFSERQNYLASMQNQTSAIGSAYEIMNQQARAAGVEDPNAPNIAQNVASYVVGVPLSIVDTFASSLSDLAGYAHENLDIIDQGDLETAIGQNVPFLSEALKQNEKGIQIAGDIIGAFIPATIGAKALRVGGFLDKAIKTTTNIDASKWLSSGKSSFDLARGVQAEAFKYGKKGFTDFANVPSLKKLAYGVRNSVRSQSYYDVILETAGAELAIATMMNSSEFLFPDDMSLMQRLQGFGIATALGVGGTYFTTRWAGDRSIRIGSEQGMKASGRVALEDAMISAQPGSIFGAGSSAAMYSEARNTFTQEAGQLGTSAFDVEARQNFEGLLRQAESGFFESIKTLTGNAPVPELTRANPALARSPNATGTLLAVSERNGGVFTLFESIDEATDAVLTGGPQLLATVQQNAQNAADKLQKVLARVNQINPNVNSPKYQKLLARANAEKARAAEYMKFIPVALDPDGYVGSLTARAPMFQDSAPTQMLQKLPKTSTPYAKIGDNAFFFSNGKVSLTKQVQGTDFSNLDVALPIGASRIDDAAWSALGHQERTGIYRLIADTADSVSDDVFSSYIKRGVVLADLTDPSTHFTSAEYILRLANNSEFTRANILSVVRGAKDLDDVAKFAMHGKFEAYQRMLAESATDPKSIYRSGINVARALNLNPDKFSELAGFWNTVITPGQGIHKFSAVFGDADNMMAMMNAARTSRAAPLGVQSAPASLGEFAGQLTTIDRRNKVLTAMAKIDQPVERVRYQAAAKVKTELARQTLQQTLRSSTNPVASTLQSIYDQLTPVIQSLRSDMPYMTATGLSDNFIESNVAGVMFRRRNVPGFQQLSDIQNAIDKPVEKMFGQMLDQPFQFMSPQLANRPLRDVFSQLEDISPARTLDRNFFFAARDELSMGWDIQGMERVASAQGDDIVQMVLAKTPQNAELYRRVTGLDMDITKSAQPTFMPNARDLRAGKVKTASAQPMGISTLAADGLQAISAIERQRVQAQQVFSAARGNESIPLKNFYFRHADMEHKFKSYFLDENGNFAFVRGADTEADLKRIVARETQNGKFTPVSEETFSDFFQLRAIAFHKMQDYTRSGIHPAGQLGSTLGGTTLTGLQEFKKIVENVTKDYLDLGREFRSTVMNGEITYLKARQLTMPSNAIERNVIDDAMGVLNGTQTIRATTENTVTKAYNLFEEKFDRAATALVEKTRETFASLTGKTKGNLVSADVLAEEVAKRFTDPATSTFLPAQTALDFSEQFLDRQQVVSLRRIGPLFNEIVAAAVLRFADMGRPMIELSSTAALLPSVTKMLQPLADDFVDGVLDTNRWIGRTGAYATKLGDNEIMALNPAKAVARATEQMFRKSPRTQQILREAELRGNLDATGIEAMNLFHRVGETKTARQIRNFVDIMSKPGDWAEKTGRAYSYLTFHNIGTDLLKLDDATAHVFANRNANLAIGDFRPSSRPRIFQGAAGLPLGLFTTYVWNFWQRSIGLLERGGFKGVDGSLISTLKSPLSTMMAVQGAVFGGASLPGWNEIVETTFSNYDGTISLRDHMLQAFGGDVTEFFYAGTLSQLPKIFNALPGEQNMQGISIGPRASVGLPFSAGYGTSAVPFLNLAGRTWQATSRVIENTVTAGEFSPRFAAEAIGVANLNRGFSNLVELTLNQSLDRRMSIIEDQTRTFAGTLPRLMGFKPLIADEFRTENARNRISEKLQAELTMRLGEAMTAKARAGNLDADAVDEALAYYMEAGGRPENFAAFMQRQVIKGTQRRIDKDILQAINENDRQRRLARLLYLESGL